MIGHQNPAIKHFAIFTFVGFEAFRRSGNAVPCAAEQVSVISFRGGFAGNPGNDVVCSLHLWVHASTATGNIAISPTTSRRRMPASKDRKCCAPMLRLTGDTQPTFSSRGVARLLRAARIERRHFS
jgi:hypothetical protein